METEKIWILLCTDATSLWHTSVTKIDVFVSCWASGFSAAGDIHKWVMWVCMDGPDDAAWLQALDEDEDEDHPPKRKLYIPRQKRNQKVSM